jgi:hypothetical protein
MSAKIHISDTGLVDYSKEAFGFKYRGYKEWWTEEEMNAEYAALESMVLKQIAEDKEMESAALVDFRSKVKETMTICNCTWDKALEYLIEEDLPYVETGLYNFGLGYEDRMKIEKLYHTAIASRKEVE